MAEKRKPKRVDIYSRGNQKIKMLEEAGDISGRTPKEAQREAEIDAMFDTTNIEEPVNEEENDILYNWWENLFSSDNE